LAQQSSEHLSWAADRWDTTVGTLRYNANKLHETRGVGHTLVDSTELREAGAVPQASISDTMTL
jgi:hypothetical protein